MPWREVKPMDERIRFLFEALQGNMAFSELCRGYGVSRKTGYKWLNRFRQKGLEGYHERKRAPRTQPRRTPLWVEELLVAERLKHPRWGPKKLVELLRIVHGVSRPPAPSTAWGILKRHDLVPPRPKRRGGRVRSWPGSLTEPDRPNRVWAIDYKGWFRTGDGNKCCPLTMTDLCSRYVLCCDAHTGENLVSSRKSCVNTFERYGLPDVIRVDNGTPFAGRGPGGLSKLSVTWLRLGIEVEFIQPGRPTQNGRHERMHRTLKADTARPPASDLARQQERFDAWREEFNEFRPHEALGQRLPGNLYEQSARAYPGEIPYFDYPGHFDRRRVKRGGEIRWDGSVLFVGDAFSGLELGLDRSYPYGAAVYAGEMLLGVIETGEGDMSPSPVFIRIV